MMFTDCHGRLGINHNLKLDPSKNSVLGKALKPIVVLDGERNRRGCGMVLLDASSPLCRHGSTF